MIKKIISVLLFIGIVITGYVEKAQLLTWIKSGGDLAIVTSVIFVAILVFFPVMPFVAVAGIIGAVFGTLNGSIISLTGAVGGALVMFLLARYGFRDFAQRYASKYPKAKEYESHFENNAFVGILLVRIIPVIPSPIINILCGISLVRWYTFLVASLFGKIPSIVIFTFAGSRFEHSKLTSILIYAVYFLVIMVLTALYIRKQQLHPR